MRLAKAIANINASNTVIGITPFLHIKGYNADPPLSFPVLLPSYYTIYLQLLKTEDSKVYLLFFCWKVDTL
jgi:hypothetical protein